MRSNKFILSAATSLCALLLAGTPTAAAAETSFQDTTGHWAEAAIHRMSGYQIVSGDQGLFRPNDSITRGEMAVILDRVMNYQHKSDHHFMDLDEAFYTDAILRANHAGIMSGANDLVRPNDPISREEAVVMLAAAFDLDGADAAIPSTDAGDISSWAVDRVSAFMQKGYINSTGAFRPQSSITRAEVMTILNHLLAGYYPASGSYSDGAAGTVVVNTQDVTLKDAVIDGDLILTEGILDGDVTLDNVTVKGRTLIRGGGTNSIHVTGDSNLGSVVMERDGAAVRLSVEDKAQVGTVVMGEKAAQAVISGTVSNVTAAGSGELVISQAKVDTLSVTSPNATVTLSGRSSIRTLEVTQHGEHTKISAERDSSIQSAQIDAQGVTVSGQGSVRSVQANADHISVDTKGTKVTAAAGTTGVMADGQSVAGGQSVTTSSGQISSGGGYHPDYPPQLDIQYVESVENGKVRVTLNCATEEPLRKDQFSILCTGGGKDMTILNVHTSDNQVYNLTTAYYNDNTYQLGLYLDDGRLLTYNFVSKYDCPAITSTKATRTAVDAAEFSFASDIAGTFYWVVQPNEAAVLRAVPQEPTAEELMRTGNQQPMELHSNTVHIPDLAEHISYTMYYVAKGTDEKVTPVKRVSIAAEPTEAPPASDITIEDIRAYNNPDLNTTYEHVYFDIRLSKPTTETLTTEQFHMSCPADENIDLGRVVTSDNQNYRVYLQPRYMIKDHNHFTCTISFADGTQTAKTFFVDLSAPNLTAIQITRLPNDKAQIQFNASEPGTIYYDVLTGPEFGYGSGGAKDPNLVLNSGKTYEIKAGTQFFEVDFSDKSAKTGLFFCFVSEDTLGNRSTFWYETIPDTAATPDPEPEPGEYQIVGITGEVGDPEPPFQRGHILTVTLNKNDTGAALLSNQAVTITGNNSIISGHKELAVSWSSTAPTEHIISLNGIVLTEGTYTLKATIDQHEVKQDFTVDAAGKINP